MQNPEKKTARKPGLRRTESRAWRFEQLESRAMLSATMVQVFYGPAMPASDMHGYRESHVAQAGMFASHEFERIEMAPSWGGWINGPIQGKHHDDHMMLGGPGPGQNTWDIGSLVPQHSSLTSKPAEPIASPPAMPKIFPDTDYGPNLTLIFQQGAYVSSNTTQGGQQPGGRASGGNGQGFENNPGGIHPNGGLNNSTGFSNGASKYLYFYAGPEAAAIFGQASSHDIDVSSLISTGALDAALQAYTAPPLLVSGTSSGQTYALSPIKDASIGDPGDEFVRLSESSSNGDHASISDALSREEAAAEDVLNSLQGVDSLSDQTNDSGVAKDNFLSEERDALAADLAFAAAFDVANMDNGMVLLQTSGDANEGPINLANVAESYPDMFSAHVGVEVSVGFYQAVDRGIEELSASDIQAATIPAAQPAKAAKPENRLSTGRETFGRKSASVVTASALAGALLWSSAHKRAEEERDVKSHHGASLAN